MHMSHVHMYMSHAWTEHGEGIEVGQPVVQVFAVTCVQSVVRAAPLPPLHTLEQDGRALPSHGTPGGHEDQQGLA